MRTTKTFSFSIPHVAAAALEQEATRVGDSTGEYIAALVTDHLASAGLLPETLRRELALLRELRDEAIDKLEDLRETGGLSKDITLRVFQACNDDPQWIAKYEEYIQGNRFQTGNPRKTNANQTIGSRIKSVLGATDVLDENGKSVRSRALGEIIQTYQLLEV